MGWKTAMIAEEALAKALKADKVGEGIEWRDGQPVCTLGHGFHALGVTEDMRSNAKETRFLGISKENLISFEERMRYVVQQNDGCAFNIPDTVIDKAKAAEIFVSAVKEFVPDKEEEGDSL